MSWKPVPGFEDRYLVSDDGRVWSKWTGSEMSPYVDESRHGQLYERVDLRRGEKRRVAYVHHLVLEAFVGERPDRAHAHHIDGNQRNNDVENLEWVQESDHVAEHNRQRAQEGEFAPKESAPF